MNSIPFFSNPPSRGLVCRRRERAQDQSNPWRQNQGRAHNLIAQGKVCLF